MSGDYDDILNRSWEEIPSEQVLPIGHWVVRAKNAAFIRPKEEGKHSQVFFSYVAYQPTDDVDEAELEELVNSGYDISITRLSHTIFIETAADWSKVKDHLASHGLTMSGKIFDDKGKLAFNADFRKTEVTAYLDQDHWEDKVTKKTKWKNTLSDFKPVGD